ncbi:phospholipase D-like domain-containing protein [Amaricoccus macauensis]|uniref:phospholipase D-like domain-containing protein n=1 Tax=Amaricoccus macauensis TaxID=57001 RepID=UPI003C7D0E1B
MSDCLRLLRICLPPLALCACTYVPFDAPRPEAKPVSSMAASRSLARIEAAIDLPQGQSGFIPLTDGNDALGARLSMIERAEGRIDLQSFLIKPDKAGSLVSLALMEAADRGVTVRLLFDDVFTKANDRQLALLASHPGIDVRLFNPLSRRSPTVVNYALDFGRVNRRMHNKAFVVDDGLAIVGGRNIADEYYQIDTESEFADFDLFVVGPVVEEISDAFETFWSDEWSVPIEALRREEPAIDVVAVEAGLQAQADTAAAGIYERAVGSAYLADVRAGRVPLQTGYAQVVTDTPVKLRETVADGTRPLAETLMGQIAGAETQVTILTPYFVPEDWGADLLSGLPANGVRVRIVTNSLAATNHPYVHAGYMRHRKRLLAAGVELYEIRADAPQALGDLPPESKARLTMHTKLAVIDDTPSVVTSFNFDPRSVKLNTEFGLFIASRSIANGFLRGIDEDLPKYTYQLSLDPEGDILWTYANDGVTETYRDEPGASASRKAIAGITRLLPVEGQL